MYVSSQVIDFLEFTLIGIIIACIFDFFRSYRKLNKVSTFTVILQDIIFFVIATVIIVISIINLLNSDIRLYIFIGIIIGISLYFSLLSKHIMKLYISFFKIFRNIISLIILPIVLFIQILQKIGRILQKISKKCCKKFSNMIFYICKLFKKFGRLNSSIFTKKNKKQKRVENEKDK